MTPSRASTLATLATAAMLMLPLRPAAAASPTCQPADRAAPLERQLDQQDALLATVASGSAAQFVLLEERTASAEALEIISQWRRLEPMRVAAAPATAAKARAIEESDRLVATICAP
jgi:hypothetical protein